MLDINDSVNYDGHNQFNGLSIETFSEDDVRKKRKSKVEEGDQKTSLVMYCNPEMRQCLVKIKSKPQYIRIYYGNMKKSTVYFNKLIDQLAKLDLTKIHELQQFSPEIPKYLSGKGIKSFTIDKDWYENICSISDYLNTSINNVGLILSYISLPIEFYIHYPRLISLYEHIEEVLNRYYILGNIKIKKLNMIKDANNKTYDNYSDTRKLLHGILEIDSNKILEINNKIDDENNDDKNNDNKNKDFKEDINVIISLLNVDYPTVKQIDYMETLVNKYWKLLIDNDYNKDLKYW